MAMTEEERGKMLGMQYLQTYLLTFLARMEVGLEPQGQTAQSMKDFAESMLYTPAQRQASAASSHFLNGFEGVFLEVIVHCDSVITRQALDIRRFRRP